MPAAPSASRPATPKAKELVEPGNQPRRPGAVRIVLVAKLRAQQPLFRADAREER